MTTTKLFYLILTTLLITSCSTINRSLSLGTASGVAIGLSLSPLKQPNNSKDAVKFGVIGVTFPCFHGHYSKQQDSFLFYTPLGSHIQVKNAFALDCTNLYT